MSFHGFTSGALSRLSRTAQQLLAFTLAGALLACTGDILPSNGQQTPTPPNEGTVSGADDGDRVPRANDGGGGGGAPGAAAPNGAGGAAESVTGCALRLTELAVYQGVKITVAKNGAAVTARSADVIQHRAALVRAFVEPQPLWTARDAEARLTVTSAAGTMTLVDRKTITTTSTDAGFATTFNFDLPASAVTEDATLQATIVDPNACDGPTVRLPSDAPAPLAARRTGIVKLALVPIAYGADGSERLPDTSDAQVTRYRDTLRAMYPVEDVQITVRTPVRTTTAMTAGAGWPMVLDALRALRAQDAPADDLYYFGLVEPAATVQQYCGNACTAGIAYVAPENDPRQRVGLGIGYPLTLSAWTLAHELGHEHGRKHAPCGNPQPADVDPEFPYPGAGVSAWGWDARTKTLLDPAQRRDIMGYCNPQWISDFTYQGIALRSALVNTLFSASRVSGPIGSALVLERPTAAPWSDGWWVLIVGPDGSARWGLPVPGPAAPAGAPESAVVRDAAGAVIADVQAFRTELGEDGWASVMVPPPRAGWASIEVRGAAAHDYAAPTAVRPLE